MGILEMLFFFGLGALLGVILYLVDDDDGTVLYYGGLLHSWLVVGVLLWLVVALLWAFDVVSAWVVLSSLGVLAGWAVGAYVMSFVWPTWSALAAWIASLVP